MRCLLPGLTLLLSVTALSADEQDGFAPLFDGKSFAGWHGDVAYWSIQEGAIVGKTDGNIPANTFLIHDAVHSNFVLKVKWKLHQHTGNSGVQYRSEQVPGDPPFVVKGYQADIAGDQHLGILYGERTDRGIIQNLDEALRAQVKEAVKPDDWNEYVITCNGDHVTQVLNGVTTVDIDDPAGAKSGIIALQLHRGHDMEISFKEIVIKQLPETAPTDADAAPCSE